MIYSKAHKIFIISFNLTLQRYGSNRRSAPNNHPNVNFGHPTKIIHTQVLRILSLKIVANTNEWNQNPGEARITQLKRQGPDNGVIKISDAPA